MKNTQTISNRCSVLIKDNVFSLVILPNSDAKKINWLLLWLIAWSVSGVIILVNYFTLTNQNEKLMIIVWLAFWVYFEYKIARVLIWKKFGKEKLWIKNGLIHYQQSIVNKGKIKLVDVNLVTEFKLIEIEEQNFADMFSQTFWVKGGERVEFNSQAKTIRFAMQLTTAEANKIITIINDFLSNTIR